MLENEKKYEIEVKELKKQLIETKEYWNALLNKQIQQQKLTMEAMETLVQQNSDLKLKLSLFQ